MMPKKILIALVMLYTTGTLLSACGPVKFSASSSGDVDQQNTPPPGGGGNGGGGDDGGDDGGGDGGGTKDPVLRDVTYTNLIAPKDYKLDIVLVIDDSNSMLADNKKLAEKLSNFVTKLSNTAIDWQMCATVTRAVPVSKNADNTYKYAWGASIFWQSSATASNALGMVLKKTSGNLPTIFTNTINYINAGWLNSDDERGIKAAYQHVRNGDYRYNPNNGCYRQDSAVTYIIISDEDERSIGGDASQQSYPNELKPLESEDKPRVLVNYIKEILGSDRRFTVNSIIVKPGDSTCKASQDASGAKSHYGFKYKELSDLTGGGVGSICATDYSENLDLFFGKISDSLSSVALECAPYNGNISVNIAPAPATAVQSRLEGMNLVFSTPVEAGKTITLQYKCVDSRSPSSVGPAGQAETPGFFTRIVNFFRNLF